MPVHDWTRVSAGTFHDFHNAWLTHLKESLNGGILPEDYYAQSEQHAGGFTVAGHSVAGVGADTMGDRPRSVRRQFSTPDSDSGYATARRTLTIRHASGHDVIALVEVVSPANKDRPTSVRQLVEKIVQALHQGCHVLLLDLWLPTPFDSTGIHGEVWREFEQREYQVPPTHPLTLTSYAANGLPTAYIEPVQVGDALPAMPLFLDSQWYVQAPLEKSYMQAFQGVPSVWKQALE